MCRHKKLCQAFSTARTTCAIYFLQVYAFYSGFNCRMHTVFDKEYKGYLYHYSDKPHQITTKRNIDNYNHSRTEFFLSYFNFICEGILEFLSRNLTEKLQRKCWHYSTNAGLEFHENQSRKLICAGDLNGIVTDFSLNPLTMTYRAQMFVQKTSYQTEMFFNR